MVIYGLAFLRHLPRGLLLCGVTLLSFLPAGALTLLHDKQATGHWLTHPFIASRARYGVPTTFAFQAVPIPQGPLTIEQQIDYDAQVAVHGSTPETLSTWLTRLAKRVAFYRFFFWRRYIL